MNTPLRIILAAALLALITPAQALACIISFEPEAVTAAADGKARVAVVIEWEHRNCELDDDEVNIDYEGVTELASSGWVKVGRGLFENTLEVQISGDSGSIRVWRDCSKKGVSEASATVSR